MGRAFTLTVDKDGIANLLFDLPNEKINKFSPEVLKEFEQAIDEAAKNDKIKLMTISSGKKDVFVAGADLHSFEPVFKDPSQGAKIITEGHRVFNKLADLPFPTVALIDGACLGGGTEMALACTYRVVSDNPKTQIGLPEVTLGIIPGWGGTQRMPKLVGLMDGLTMVLTGKPVKSDKAVKMKLADAIYAAEFFKTGAEGFVKQCLTKEGAKGIIERRKKGGITAWLFEKNPIGRAIVFSKAKKDVLSRTKGHYPAPLVALNLIKETYGIPLKEGLAKEEKTFSDSLISSFANAPNLIHLFFVNEALKKNAGAPVDGKPKPVEKAAVIGAGTMGSGIAWLFSNKDIPVRMKDIDWAILGKGFSSINAINGKLVKDRRMKPGEASLKFHKVTGTTDYSGFSDADLVMEAAVESIDLKHKILKELEGVLRPDAVIGTNTSSLKVSDMASVLKHPERLVGMHFFNPANKMPLVEVVASDKTSPEAVATAVDVCRKLGKTPIVVRDCPGFLVNRVFMAGANEVMRMYEEGADFKRIERMMLEFGMPMSPFVLADEVGNDVGYKVGKTFEEAYGSRFAIPKIVTLMYEKKLFGKKSGKGFYVYDGDKKTINPEVAMLRRSTDVKDVVLSDEEMRDRVFLQMINESARCLEEGIIVNPSYLDMALIMGIGFPPFRGGLLKYADTIGIDAIVERLKGLQRKYGERFTPCQRLLDMQRDHKSFFP